MKARSIAFLALFAAVLVGCTGVPSGVRPVEGFEPGRYLGDWYAIARLDHRFERGLTRVSATYAERADGLIGVVNRGFDETRCSWREIEGRARFLGDRDVASLAVSFSSLIEGGYHVIALDEGYRWSMVSGPTRGYLWILAREPALDRRILEALVARAGALGYPVGDLILVDHAVSACG